MSTTDQISCNRSWVLCLVALCCGTACKTQQEKFAATTFRCDPTQPDQCGTSDDGRPLACYSSEQLGGQALCTDRCDTTVAPEEGLVCLASSTKLRVCQPSLGRTGGGECPDKTSCYRTDLVKDEGLCMPMEVCSQDADCPSPTRSTCAASIVKEAYPTATNFQTGNLHCLQRGCMERQANCPAGETCLRSALKTNPAPPDICVPHCDSSKQCPPNFYCFRAVSGADSPDVCVPGVVGLRCATSLDCLAGDCIDIGLDFNVCGVPCARQDDCLPFFSGAATFCLPDVVGPGKHCVSARPFAGATCLSDSVCPAGQRCAHGTVYDPQFVGECRVPCDEQERCQPRAGLGHVCLKAGDERTCYPGRFGLPCNETSECGPPLTCSPVAPDSRGPPEGTRAWGYPRICSVPCQTDAECDANPWTERSGFCEAGVCRLGSGTNDVCTRAAQCRSDNCVIGDAGIGRCGPSLGGNFR